MYMIILNNMTGEERGRVHIVNDKLVASGNDDFVNGEVDFYNNSENLTWDDFFTRSTRAETFTSYLVFDDDETEIIYEHGRKLVLDPETQQLVEKKD